MRGAVYKRGSTWHFDIDPDPLTGRRRQRTKGGYKTKKAAEQALAEAIGQWRSGRLPSAPPTPLATSCSKSGCLR
jgi:Arm DNA-binding domain